MWPRTIGLVEGPLEKRGVDLAAALVVEQVDEGLGDELDQVRPAPGLGVNPFDSVGPQNSAGKLGRGRLGSSFGQRLENLSGSVRRRRVSASVNGGTSMVRGLTR